MMDMKKIIIGLSLMLVAILQMIVVGAGGGKWDLLRSNIGVYAMHMQLLNNDRVVIFDLTDFGASNISLPNNRCRSGALLEPPCLMVL